MTQAKQYREINALRRNIPEYTEADYRDLLREKFGVASTKDLNHYEAAGLIGQLRALAGPNRFRRSAAARADGKFAGVLQSLWISAFNLGLVRDRTDKAMLAYVERQTGLAHTRFLTDPADAMKAIEGLKAWIAREANVVWPARNDAVARKREILRAQTEIVRQATPTFDPSVYAPLVGSAPPDACDGPQLDALSKRIGVMIRKQTKPERKELAA